MEKSQNKPLTARRIAFAHHYVGNKFNGTQAAISAGYSEDTAASQAERLLRNVEVKTLIEKLQAKVVAKSTKGAEDVYNMAANAAFFDVRKVLTVKGGRVEFSVEDFADLPDDVAQMIQSVEEKKTMHGTTIKVTFVDKLKALEMLARFNGMNKDSLKVENPHEGKSVEELAAILKAKREAGIE